MSNSPIDKSVVDAKIKELRIYDVGKASIREIVGLVNLVEEATGIKYIRMEMGVPGLPAAQIGVDAEIEALKKGVASVYPLIDGIKPLKEQAALFVKNFMNVKISSRGCVPTVGSMQGTFSAFMAAGFVDKKKDTALFIDPGFPAAPGHGPSTRRRAGRAWARARACRW